MCMRKMTCEVYLFYILNQKLIDMNRRDRVVERNRHSSTTRKRGREEERERGGEDGRGKSQKKVISSLIMLIFEAN